MMKDKLHKLSFLLVMMTSLIVGCGGVDKPDDVDSVKDFLENPEYQDEEEPAKKKKKG